MSYIKPDGQRIVDNYVRAARFIWVASMIFMMVAIVVTVTYTGG